MPFTLAWCTKELFDSLVTMTTATAETVKPRIALLAIAGAGATAIGQLLGVLGGVLRAEHARQLQLKSQRDAYRALNRLPALASFERADIHNAAHVSIDAGHGGPQQLLASLTTLVRQGTVLSSFAWIATVLNPLLTGLILLATGPFLVVQLLIGRQRTELALAQSGSQRLVGYYAFLFTSPGSARELRLYGLGEYLLTRWETMTHRLHREQRLQGYREAHWHTALTLVAGSLSVLSFTLVVRQAALGRMSVGDIALFSGATVGVQAALITIAGVVGTLQESILSQRHYDALLNPGRPAPSTPSRTIPTLSKALRLHDVTFGYGTQGQGGVLEHCSLTIPAGRSVALIGVNGAGKSTIAKLLTRLYEPQGGNITWDGIDIRDFDHAALREKFAVVCQDFFRFALTAQENIGVGDVARIAEAGPIRDVAERVGLDERLSQLPAGYRTMLQPWFAQPGQGAELSGGEWQRLALARALLRHAEVLVLDEPTAALDPLAEIAIQAQFADLIRGRTSLVITHRLSMARLTDLIAVLDDGRIVEYGTHDELLRRSGMYAALFETQASAYAQPIDEETARHGRRAHARSG